MLLYTSVKDMLKFGKRLFGASQAKQSNWAVTRNPRYAQLKMEDLKTFEGMLGNRNVITDEHDLQGFNMDWTRKYIGKSSLLLKPETTE